MFSEGQIIKSRYILGKFLGVGVFGEVWSAYDNILDMDVAIKLYTSSDESSISKLQQEYKNTFNLSHENILSPKHFDVTEGCPFMIYSLCRAGSVRKLIGCVEEKTVWRIIRDVSKALNEIHRQSLIHQNLKPENILINDNNSFVISDMALSKSTRATMSKESMDRYTSSIAYKAPESKLGKSTIKSDIWSLGAITFELLIGYLPNKTELSDVDLLLSKKGCTKLLCDTIFSCLSFDDTIRPSAKQLFDVSERILKGEDVINDKGKNPPYFNNTQREGMQSTKHDSRLTSRHWFVATYIWGLLLISLLLMMGFYGYGFENLYKLKSGFEISDYEASSLYVHEYFIIGLLFSVMLLGELLLLKKLRIGYIVSSAALFCAVYAICKTGEELSILMFLFSFGVTAFYMLFLWLILLIRKGGYSQWKTMARNINFMERKWIVWCATVFFALYIICELFTL